MKKILLILLFLPIIGFGQDRLLNEELINKGTNEKPIMFYEGRLFSGIGYDIWSNGELKYEWNYRDGLKDGLFRLWYENGKLGKQINYKDGKRNGLSKRYYKNGRLEIETNYRDDGTSTQKNYYEDGTLKSIINWKNALMDGKVEDYYLNGVLHYMDEIV